MNIVPEPLDQARFIRGGHTVLLGPREGFLQQRAGEGLRSLRQHNALAGDGGGDECDVFGEARALHFLDRVDRRNAQDGGTPRPCLSDHALHLLPRDERARRVVHQHDFRVCRDFSQRAGHRFLAGAAPAHDPYRPAQSLLRDPFFKRGYVLSPGGDDEVGDGRAGGQTTERKDHQRHTIQLEKLFGRLGAHAGT